MAVLLAATLADVLANDYKLRRPLIDNQNAQGDGSNAERRLTRRCLAVDAQRGGRGISRICVRHTRDGFQLPHLQVQPVCYDLRDQRQKRSRVPLRHQQSGSSVLAGPRLLARATPFASLRGKSDSPNRSPCTTKSKRSHNVSPRSRIASPPEAYPTTPEIAF